MTKAPIPTNERPRRTGRPAAEMVPIQPVREALRCSQNTMQLFGTGSSPTFKNIIAHPRPMRKKNPAPKNKIKVAKKCFLFPAFRLKLRKDVIQY